MHVVHFTTDLMLGSQVGQAARPRGIRVDQVHRLEQLFERVHRETALIILDLQCAQWSGDEFQSLRSASPYHVPCLAYSQHVFPELLEEATRVGVPTVMTRGQFAKNVSQIMDRLAVGPP